MSLVFALLQKDYIVVAAERCVMPKGCDENEE
jgi:hypothetical protein